MEDRNDDDEKDNDTKDTKDTNDTKDTRDMTHTRSRQKTDKVTNDGKPDIEDHKFLSKINPKNVSAAV